MTRGWVEKSVVGDAKVYRQTTAPDPDTVALVRGDYWVKTNDPNLRTFRWNGINWVGSNIWLENPERLLILDISKDTVVVPAEGSTPDFTDTQYEIKLYKDSYLIPLTTQPSPTIGNIGNNEWFILDAVEVDVDYGPPLLGQLSYDTFNDKILVPDMTGFSVGRVTGTVKYTAAYKDTTGEVYYITKTVTYITSSVGADAVTATGTVLLTVYRRTESNTPPGTPDNTGNYSFTTNTLNPPSNWSKTPNDAGEDTGYLWVSTAFLTEDGNEPQTITSWSTPDLYRVLGTKTKLVHLYTATNTTPPINPVADGLYAYDFDNSKMIVVAGGADFVSHIDGSGNTWTTTKPSTTTEKIWTVYNTFAVPQNGGIDATTEWSVATLDTAQGRSTYLGALYQKTATGGTPTAVPANDIVAWNFDLEQYEDTGLPGVEDNTFGDWTTTVPTSTEGETVWVTRSTFTTFGGFGTDSTSTWSAPVVFSVNSLDGFSYYTVSVYQNLPDGSTPTAPTGGVYNFNTGELSTVPAGWSASIPAYVSGFDVIWESHVLAESDDPTASVVLNGWANPAVISTRGIDGRSVEVIYRRSNVFPTTPTPSETTPTNWFDTIAAADADGSSPAIQPDSLLYQSIGTRTEIGGNFTWQTPVRLEGGVFAEIVAYRRSAAGAPSTPVGGTYNFATGTLAPPTGWDANIPPGTDPTYMVKTTAFAKNATVTNASVGTWSTPGLVFQNGTDGADGADGDPGPPGPPGSDGADGADGLDGSYSGIIVISKASTATPTTADLTAKGLDPLAVKAGTYAVVYNTAGTAAQGYYCTVGNTDPLTWVTANTVFSDVIAANAITAEKLQISSDQAGFSRIFFNGAANRIEIYGSASAVTPQVMLGDLT